MSNEFNPSLAFLLLIYGAINLIKLSKILGAFETSTQRWYHHKQFFSDKMLIPILN